MSAVVKEATNGCMELGNAMYVCIPYVMGYRYGTY